MDVLVVLCRHAGEIISAEQLLAECWGSTIYGDNPVHKIITQLRRVLGDNASEPVYIETIRKRGYRTLAEVKIVQDLPELSGQWQGGSPFRGLQAFDEEYAQVFYGRDAIITQLQQALHAQVVAGYSMLTVLGPSGSGKTSVLCAGLFPSLRDYHEERVHLACSSVFDLAELRDQNLFISLAAALLDWEIQDRPIFPSHSAYTLAACLEHDPAGVCSQVHQALQQLPQSSPLLSCAVLLDRFEVVFNKIHQSGLQSFLNCLEYLAKGGGIIICIACRNDFYPQLVQYPQLTENKNRGGHFDLSAPGRAEIAQIIRTPAQAAGLYFGKHPQNGAHLDDVLLEAASKSSDTLPLLQYTLQELYRLRREDGELSFAALDELGGLEGAIGRRAEQVVGNLQPAQLAELEHVMGLLVVMQPQGENFTSQRAKWSDLRSEAARQLVTALVDSRLFVSELVGMEAGFGIAHEAILRRWPRIGNWLEQHRDALRVRAQLNQLANRWQQEGQSHELLLPPGRLLNEAKDLLKIHSFSLLPHELNLIHASTAKARRLEYVKVTAIGLILALALLASILGFSALQAKRTAEQRSAEAEDLMGFMLNDFADKLRPLGKLDLLDGISNKALEYLSKPGRDNLNQDALAQRAQAMQVLGEVKLTRGERKEAAEAFRQAQAILLQDLRNAPSSVPILQNLGINAFWRGQIALQQSELTAAQVAFTEYLSHTHALQRLQPENVEWQIEASYANNSLGTLALRQNRLQDAITAFQTSIALKEKSLQRPAISADKQRTWQAELADSYSWLAKCEEKAGDLGAALALYQKEMNLVQALYTQKNDALWANRLALALQHRASMQAMLGQTEGAIDLYRQAQGLIEQNLKMEPQNRGWNNSLIFVQLEQARLRLLTRAPDFKLQELESLLRTMQGLLAKDGKHLDWVRQEIRILLSMTQAAMSQDKLPLAASYLQTAQTKLRDSLKNSGKDALSLRLQQESLLLEAELLSRQHKPDDAHITQLCKQAASLLPEDMHERFLSLPRRIRINTCLQEHEAVRADIQTLAKLGFKSPEYLSFLRQAKLQPLP